MDFVDHNKIINTLTKLLDPNIAQTVSEKHLNCLLKYLSGQEEDLGATGNPLLDETYYIPWIKQAVEKWKRRNSYIPKHILTFVTELTAAMCTNEQIFVKLNFTQVLEDFIEILRSLPDPNTTDRIKLSYIKLISSFLYHQSGKQWLMVTNYWFDIFSMITSNNGTGEIAKTSCKFIIELIEKSLESNEIFCRNIIETILIPLKDLSIIYSENPSTEIDGLIMVLIPLKNILEGLLILSTKKNDTKVILLLRDHFTLEDNLRKLIKIVNNLGIKLELIRILFLVLMISTFDMLIHFSYNGKLEGKTNANDIFKVFMDVMYYHGIMRALDLIFYHQITFQEIVRFLRNKELGESSSLYSNYQVILFIVYPVQKMAMNILADQQNEHDEIRLQLTYKIIKYLLPMTMEAYSQLNSYPINVTVEDCTLSLQYLVNGSQFYSHKVANTATQIIIYVLVDIFNALKFKPEVIQTLPQEFFISLLETIAAMLKNFDLDFKDNMETTYLTEITSKFLDIYPWPPKVVVKALQLLDVGISRSLSPNMALLIDLADNEVDFRKIIASKLRDLNWEVKNAAINVVTSICLKVKKKFDTYRQLVLEADFPNVILKIASIESEPPVVISAIRCLQEMVRIPEFWNKLFENLNIYEQILQMYSLQPEGIIRSEAVVLLKIIYEHHHLTENVLEKMYSNMYQAVIEDPHCSVKLKGIEFWHQVVERHLQYEGMLDGVFPAITFSMSLKKIITFDDHEIKNCLTRVLDRLDEINCLKIFLYVIRCDTNDEVKTYALKLIKKFMDLLKKYMSSNSSSTIHNFLVPRQSTLTIEQIIRHNFMNNPMIDISPNLEKFYEDVLDLEEISNSVPSPASILSNDSSERVKSSDKTEFLKLAFEFESFLSNEVRKKEEKKEDFNSVVNHILNL